MRDESFQRGKLSIIGEYIKAFGNARDVWQKKSALEKILVGPAWAQKFSEFFVSFDARKKEFQFALQVHTALKLETIAKDIDKS